MGARRDPRPPRAGRRVTLKRRPQAGREAGREPGAAAPREPHWERSCRPGAAGEGSRSQTHRGDVRLAGAAGRASAPAGLPDGEVKGPMGFPPLEMKWESSEDQERFA